MVTMNDIAERAGVSRPTVSVVLNERHEDIGIAEETRLKVLAVAEELGYRRNELARAVKTGKSRTLGFLAGTVHMEYAARCFSGMLDAAEDRGYSIQRFRISEDSLDTKSIVRCVEHRLAGVVVYDPDSRLPFDVMRQEFEAHNLPAVLLDFKTPHDWGTTVASDDEMGARQAVEHLAALGHKRIVFSGGIENTGTAIPRLAGFNKAMLDCGLYNHKRVVWTNWSLEREAQLIDQLMAETTPPTAILCGSDPMALHALRHLRSIGKNVPEDVSVIGFGDLARTDLSDPSLTTVAVPYEQMGLEAVRLLLEPNSSRMPDVTPEGSPQVRYLPTSLTVRRSTAAPHPE
jgi:DNA-binding LacI/PurR family transcriptional regulator